jgi:hypothetical protein
VIGIRDIGGDFSGEVETIAVEVKRGSTPFVNACGQAFGYSVYSNRVYLADLRDHRFTQDDETTWERRFFCPDCVDVILKPLYGGGSK